MQSIASHGYPMSVATRHRIARDDVLSFDLDLRKKG
jgi:hypothetical protein